MRQTRIAISIIIAVYNGADLIGRCLGSIAVQTIKPDEIIVVDDGSTDNTYEKVKTILEKDGFSGIKKIVFRQENAGPGAARNKGIELASSEYITFIDHDDFVSRKYIEEYTKALENDRCDMLIGGFLRADGTGKVTRKVVPKEAPYTRYALTYTMGRFVKREFLIKNGIRYPDIRIGEDAYFNMIAFSYTDNVRILSKALYVWVVNPISASNDKKSFLAVDQTVTFDLILNDFSSENHIPYDYQEYYFLKFTVWYLLYSSRKTDYQTLCKLRKTMFSWLENNYPDYLKNRNISPLRPKGELPLNRIAVWGYMIFKRVGLDKVLLQVINHL